jgi:hypothetical protein
MATKKKKTGTPRNDVTLAIETKKSKKQAQVDMANDELVADIMTKAIHSPLAQEGLDQLGVENMTRLFKHGTKGEFGEYHPKGHKNAKKFKTKGHVGEKRFRKPGYESVVIATKDIPQGGNENVPSQFRTVATHEYGHKSLYSSNKLRTSDAEAVLTRQDMRDSDPKERGIGKRFFDARYIWTGAPKSKRDAINLKADKMLAKAQAAAKKRLIKRGIYIKPPKRKKNK